MITVSVCSDGKRHPSSNPSNPALVDVLPMVQDKKLTCVSVSSKLDAILEVCGAKGNLCQQVSDIVLCSCVYCTTIRQVISLSRVNTLNLT